MKRAIPIILLLFGLVACDLFAPVDSSPRVTSSSPSDGDQNVPLDADISAQLTLINNSAIDATTLGNNTVKLTKEGSEALLSGDPSSSESTITFDPDDDLEAGTRYTFKIENVEDDNGVRIRPYSMTFTTFDPSNPQPPIDNSRPIIQRAAPEDGETGVEPETSVSLYPVNADGGIDRSTNTASNVKLIEVDTNTVIEVVLGTSGGSDIIVLDPTETLEENTTYRVEVTEGLKDQAGKAFNPFTSTFTTGTTTSSGPSNIKFSRQTVSEGRDSYTSLAIGPDRKLYATTPDGRIKRFPINADGTLGSEEVISSLVQEEGRPRLLIGFAFDPSSTPGNLIAWVSHTYVDDAFKLKDIDEPWSGKITRLSGPNLETVQDYVVGLPRSTKDHVTNSIAFKPGEPDVLYFNQGSNSAMGDPDSAWNFKEEQLLSAATLRLDVSKLSSTSLPLDVQTEGGASYDPFSANAPLTIFGSGIRNAYDLVWHSNGQLYVPTNGSKLGGIVPRYDLNKVGPGGCSTRPEGGYNGPVLDSENDVNGEYIKTSQTDGWKVAEQVQNDFLFRVEEGGYYGHPNPKRCEWILNGGGTSNDASKVNIYKSNTRPDPNYKGFAYDFEKNKSPNGVIEYVSNTLGGALKGKLLVARYSNEDDIIVLDPSGSNNDISGEEAPDDLDNFSDPIDLVEDTTNGNLYVSEFDENEDTQGQKITLLIPAN